jgi:cysteine desulfurase
MPAPVVYLDNAATTPLLREVRDAMAPFLGADAFGNPSSPHQYGRAARAAVEQARRQVAAAVGADPRWVYFTSGGTEADNLAVLGGALASRAAGRPFAVAVSSVEHKAVHAAAHAVESLGGSATELRVDRAGVVDVDAVDEALAAGTTRVAVMWVNNETGVLQHVQTLAERSAHAGAWLVVDAVQALGKVPCSLADLPRTMLTLSAHKIGGPKGVGALVLSDAHAVQPLIHGGGQQDGIRPGTENVPGIVGFGVAAEMAARGLSATAGHLRSLRDAFEDRLHHAVPDAVIHAADRARAPHVSGVAFPGTDSEAMLMHLDLAGVCCSSGSACTTGAVTPSHVLTAMGVAQDVAVATLRFSFGRQNTMADVDRALDVLPRVVAKVRDLGKVLGR